MGGGGGDGKTTQASNERKGCMCDTEGYGGETVASKRGENIRREKEERPTSRRGRSPPVRRGCPAAVYGCSVLLVLACCLYHGRWCAVTVQGGAVVVSRPTNQLRGREKGVWVPKGERERYRIRVDELGLGRICSLQVEMVHTAHPLFGPVQRQRFRQDQSPRSALVWGLLGQTVWGMIDP